MLTMTAKTIDHFDRLHSAAHQAAFRNFGHAAASIMNDARQSIERSDEPSEPGEPPHTRSGQLPRAIQYAADAEGAVIGPVYSEMAEAAAAHEHGEFYKGQQFEKRPVMAPALDRAIPRLGGDWHGSIGQ